MITSRWASCGPLEGSRSAKGAAHGRTKAFHLKHWLRGWKRVGMCGDPYGLVDNPPRARTLTTCRLSQAGAVNKSFSLLFGLLQVGLIGIGVISCRV